MNPSFDVLINSFIENQVGLSKDFLPSALLNHLKKNLEALYLHEDMKLAGIGNQDIQQHDKLIRNDKIHWLDVNHDNKYENEFFAFIDQFVLFLNQTCYTGITGYEFHYTLYEKGSFYAKHLDQFKNNGDRAYSMIMYLNENWVKADGGELCIYHETTSQLISPQNGTCVFFKSSQSPHEVLITHKPRMSITGWLKTN